MSFLLDQRTFGHRGLLRAIRTFVCGFPHTEDIRISQGGAGSVGSGEIFAHTGPTAQTGRLRLKCTTGGGANVALFSLDYINDNVSPSAGSPPPSLSPDFQSPLFPSFSQTLVADQPFEENDVWIHVETTVDWVVDNFIDIDLIPSPNTTPWTERRFLTDATQSPEFEGVIEWITQGPGDGSPEAEVTIGMQTHTDGASSEFNIRMNYFTTFTQTSPETDFNSQPGRGGTTYMMSNVAGLDLYITVNSRRFMAAARMNTGVWTTCFCGFIEPLAGLVSYPYPIAIGGTIFDGTNFALSSINKLHSSFWDPDATTSTVNDGPLSVRTPVGGNQIFANKLGTTGAEGFNNTAINNVVWPWGNSHQVQSTLYRDNIERMGRGPVFGSPQQRAFVVLRAQLFSIDFAGAPQTLGFLDGVFFIPGETASSIAGGDTFTLESPEVTYLVVQDTFRVNPASFAAFRMDPD